MIELPLANKRERKSVKPFEVLGALLMLAVVILLVVFAWVYVISFVMLIFGLSFIIWAIGTRIAITQTKPDGTKTVIGHVRWFTFTRI